MAIWTSEIKELERLYESFKVQLPILEKELERLIKADDENMILLYSRRSLEVIITDLCECELKRPRKTEPLKGIIDKLHKEGKVPSNIITSMDHLNSLSAYGAHPKDYDPEQVKPVLVNLDIIIKWYLKYKDSQIVGKPKSREEKNESKQSRVLPPKKSIIVLPFENMSPDPDQEYFSDGLTEEIITDLSYIKDLLVISRSSAMTFKGSNKKIKDIASEVNVQYVLEGSVRKAGNNLRITAQLIDGTSDSHIWAEKYSGTLDDVFDIQEKVSSSIANELKLKLSLEERIKVLERPIKNIQAFEYYLRAKQEINNFTENSLNKAIDYLQKGLSIEGENSQLYAELAHVYYQFWNIGIRFEESDLEKATEYVNKAFELDSVSPDGNFVSGLLEFTGGNVKKSVSYFKKVFQTSPNHSNALLWSGMFYAILGNSIEANLCIKRLEQIDPFMPILTFLPVMVNLYNGRLELAEELSQKLGSDDFSIMLRTWVLIYNNKSEEALNEINKASEISKNNYMFRATFLLVYAYQKKKKEAIHLIDDKFLLWAKKDGQYSLFVAEAYAMLNYNTDALNWLENSINRGMINYLFLNEYDPLLENIRGEERYKRLMERVKYEWENYDV